MRSAVQARARDHAAQVNAALSLPFLASEELEFLCRVGFAG